MLLSCDGRLVPRWHPISFQGPFDRVIQHRAVYDIHDVVVACVGVCVCACVCVVCVCVRVCVCVCVYLFTHT